jgi:menaquinone-dependent protoporphyrinogen oxidase
MNNTGSDEASMAARAAYTAPVRQLLPEAGEVFFAGAIALDKLSLLDRLMVNMVKSPVGDFRDWPAIRGWAQGILG